MRQLRILLAFLLLLVPLAASAQTFPKLTGRVVDAAKLLNPQQVAELTQLSEQVEQASSRQLVVATIPDLQGYPIEDYGYRLGRAWGIGQKDANNGIMLIVAPNERKVRIEVGFGLEPIMTDALSNSIIQETIIPRFKAGDMPGGIVAGAQAIGEQMKLPLEAAEARAKQKQDQTASQTRASPNRGKGSGFPWGLVFWGIILIFVIIPMFTRRRARRGPWGQAYRGRSGGSDWPIILWSIANEMGRHSDDRGSDWGGWGGGGGGGWGGGGGGGFSGGGGSFGGGGASGSW